MFDDGFEWDDLLRTMHIVSNLWYFQSSLASAAWVLSSWHPEIPTSHKIRFQSTKGMCKTVLSVWNSLKHAPDKMLHIFSYRYASIKCIVRAPSCSHSLWLWPNCRCQWMDGTSLRTQPRNPLSKPKLFIVYSLRFEPSACLKDCDNTFEETQCWEVSSGFHWMQRFQFPTWSK